jgi:transcriptional regulator GlxA family with amidase domain
VSHEDGIADDRSVSLTYTGAEGPTFRALAVARTPALERLRLAVLGLAVAPPDAGRSLDLDAAALAIVAEASGDRAEPTPRTGRDGVQAALDFLGEHALDDEIDLARLAEAAALSPFHLHRLFRAELGLTPGRYLARVRLEHAAGLLLDSDRPVTQIAFDAGFGSLGHFHALFRRAYRRTPGEYRRLGPLA